jgi:[acyl-carrier-protein] S-malonyltransferase
LLAWGLPFYDFTYSIPEGLSEIEKEINPMLDFIIFPGQGAQKVGMGQAFLDHPLYKAHLQAADEMLGYALSDILHHGPADKLKETQYAQLALYVVETGIYKLWQAAGAPLAALVAGHSLGEYSALYAAGVISFAQGLHWVKHRAQWMQQDCEAQTGGMVAIIRPHREALSALLQGYPEVVLANDNSEQQVVLSGASEALEEVIGHLKAQKQGKVIPLAVSGAFHSPLMKNASEKMAQLLQHETFTKAQIPIVMNSQAKALQEPEAIKQALITQILSPVYWKDTLLHAQQHGIHQVFEMGPVTLKRLVEQTLQNIPVHSVFSPEELKSGLGFAKV